MYVLYVSDLLLLDRLVVVYESTLTFERPNRPSLDNHSEVRTAARRGQPFSATALQRIKDHHHAFDTPFHRVEHCWLRASLAAPHRFSL